MEITIGGKTLAMVRIESVIFLGDPFSLLFFVIEMLTLSYILKNSRETTNLQNYKKT